MIRHASQYRNKKTGENTMQLKKNMIFAGAMLATMFASHAAISSEEHPCSFSAMDTEVSQTIHFSEGKLIEVAFLSVKKGKQKQLNEQYFKQVMPIAGEYGMKHLVNLMVTDIPSGTNTPQMVGFFEWPSLEARLKFSKDKRFLRIKGIRDDALSYLKEGYFSVKQDTDVTFKQNHLYEVYAMWMNPKNAPKMGEYFKRVGATAHKFGARFPISFNPVPNTIGSYQPHVLGVAEWPDSKSNKAFFATRTFKNAKHLRSAAVDTLDVLHTKLIVPPTRK